MTLDEAMVSEIAHLKHKQQRKKNNTLDFIKTKNCVHQRTLSRKQKDTPQNGGKYLQIIDLIRVSCPEYRKNSYHSTTKRQSDLKMDKGAEETRPQTQGFQGPVSISEKLNDLSWLRNANPTHKEIPSHTYWDGCRQNDGYEKCRPESGDVGALARCWRTRRRTRLLRETFWRFLKGETRSDPVTQPCLSQACTAERENTCSGEISSACPWQNHS